MCFTALVLFSCAFGSVGLTLCAIGLVWGSSSEELRKLRVLGNFFFREGNHRGGVVGAVASSVDCVCCWCCGLWSVAVCRLRGGGECCCRGAILSLGFGRAGG